MLYGSNYVGHIETNTWGTTFDLYDDGINEQTFKALPENICSLRQKIVKIYNSFNLKIRRL